jgi:signal peptidase II
MKSPYKYLLFALILIIIDQAIKLWMFYDVRINHYGEIDLLPNVFKLHYVENKGMAFGMELGGEYGKLILTLFRLIAMVGIGWYLVHLAKIGSHDGLLWSIGAVLGGAIGNVIDSTFYGVYLDNAPYGVSTKWFHGQVIDMFYTYGLDGNYPDWIPFIGGQYNTTPIFNFADACIFCGVVSILIFQKSFFAHASQTTHSSEDTANEMIEEIEEKTENEAPNNEIIDSTENIETENKETKF